MRNVYTKIKFDKKYVAVSAIAVLFSWTLHELAHWAVGEYLGYKMAMTLNASYPLSGQYSQGWHYQLISASGPIFTLCEAIFSFCTNDTTKADITLPVHIYLFLYAIFLRQLLAFVILMTKQELVVQLELENSPCQLL